MSFNAGQEHMGEYDALNYFGSDEYIAGVEGGKYLASKGGKKILCHIQNPGAVNLETRCKGVEMAQRKPVSRPTSCGFRRTLIRTWSAPRKRSSQS